MGGKIPPMCKQPRENPESLDESLRSTKQVQEKRLRINTAEIQCMLESKGINKINWIPSKENLADGLTKRGIDTCVLLQCISTGKLKFSSMTNVFMKICLWKNSHYCLYYNLLKIR